MELAAFSRLARYPSHPNLIKMQFGLMDSFSVNLGFELCTTDLLEVVLSSKALTEENARSWTCQLVGAVSHLHACGIAHLDVKLENIFIDQNGRLKLGDLGLCALAPSGSRLSKVCGSGVYAAPEVLAAKELGPYDPHAADAWSIGVCSFVMVRGRFPFSAQHPAKLLDAHKAAAEIAARNGLASQEPPRVLSYHSQRDAFSPKLMEMIDACVCLDPERRPTARDLLMFAWLSDSQHAANADARRDLGTSGDVKASIPIPGHADQDMSVDASENGSDVPSSAQPLHLGVSQGIDVDSSAMPGGIGDGYSTPTNNVSPTIGLRKIATPASPSGSKLASGSPSRKVSPFVSERRNNLETRPAPYHRSKRASKASPLLAGAASIAPPAISSRPSLCM